MNFFAYRAIAGTENVTKQNYERLIMYKGVQGWIRISLA